MFERLALPGFSRAARFELLATLGAAGLYELEPDQLQLGTEDDPRRRPPSGSCSPATGCCSSAARATWRRAAELPLAALDRALALWGDPAAEIDPAEELPAAMRSALALR